MMIKSKLPYPMFIPCNKLTHLNRNFPIASLRGLRQDAKTAHTPVSPTPSVASTRGSNLLSPRLPLPAIMEDPFESTSSSSQKKNEDLFTISELPYLDHVGPVDIVAVPEDEGNAMLPLEQTSSTSISPAIAMESAYQVDAATIAPPAFEVAPEPHSFISFASGTHDDDNLPPPPITSQSVHAVMPTLASLPSSYSFSSSMSHGYGPPPPAATPDSQYHPRLHLSMEAFGYFIDDAPPFFAGDAEDEREEEADSEADGRAAIRERAFENTTDELEALGALWALPFWEGGARSTSEAEMIGSETASMGVDTRADPWTVGSDGYDILGKGKGKAKRKDCTRDSRMRKRTGASSSESRLRRMPAFDRYASNTGMGEEMSDRFMWLVHESQPASTSASEADNEDGRRSRPELGIGADGVDDAGRREDELRLTALASMVLNRKMRDLSMVPTPAPYLDNHSSESLSPAIASAYSGLILQTVSPIATGARGVGLGPQTELGPAASTQDGCGDGVMASSGIADEDGRAVGTLASGSSSALEAVLDVDTLGGGTVNDMAIAVASTHSQARALEGNAIVNLAPINELLSIVRLHILSYATAC
jgi:hypothetical protein